MDYSFRLPAVLVAQEIAVTTRRGKDFISHQCNELPPESFITIAPGWRVSGNRWKRGHGQQEKQQRSTPAARCHLMHGIYHRLICFGGNYRRKQL
jgi:hypothetical protein